MRAECEELKATVADLEQDIDELEEKNRRNAASESGVHDKLEQSMEDALMLETEMEVLQSTNQTLTEVMPFMFISKHDSPLPL